MSRPGLIIGLGGTGQWVLTWLKRDLLLANNGEMPSNVRLLAIDTATQLEAGVRRVQGRDEEAVQVGDVRLGSGEFIYVGGNSRPLAVQIKEGDLPNIGQWYHAERWLDTMPPAVFILDDGAGRIRQFGRIAVFKDVLGQDTNSRIWTALRTAIQNVAHVVDEQLRLEIMVVGSFAGGTGSGMFLDIALILRLLAQELGVHHVLRGFFALPGVFASAPDVEMKARTFAAWRELNRFMVVNSDFPMPLVEYVPEDPTFRVNPTQRIFDACYLVDSKRDGVAIAAEAKMGVHPMVAEVISAILDQYAGTDYTQYIFTNLAPEYARTPDKPMYSVLGSYTVQVPAHYKQEKSRLVFTGALLRQMLQPKQGWRQAVGAERLLAIAAPDQNLEKGEGFTGRAYRRELLKSSSISYQGESARVTLFMGRIAGLVEQAVDKSQWDNVVLRLAQAAGSEMRRGASNEGWVANFTNLGDDPDIDAVRKQVQAEVNYNLVAAFKRREKQSAEEVRTNFPKINDAVRSHYGGGTSSGETHGTFGDALQLVSDHQLELFRRRVRLFVLDTLMGRSTQDPITAKSGKLGFSWDLLDGVVDEFEDFLRLLRDIQQKREELRPEIKLAAQAAGAQAYMERNADRKFLWWELPVVKGSENTFLQAQQRRVDLRKEVLVHLYVEATAKAMKEIAEQARDTLRQWIWHLATGDDPSKTPGLLSGIEHRLDSVESDFRLDTRISTVQRLVATDVAPVEREDLAQALGQWEWLGEYVGTPPRFVLQARINPEAAGEEALTLVDPSLELSDELRFRTGRLNQHRLLKLGGRRFAGVAARTTVQQAVKETYPDVERFATEVAKGTEPLFEGSVRASPRRKSNLIRVASAPNDPYFYGEHGLEGALRTAANLNPAKADDKHNIRVVNSENPYKLTLVRTDDLYEPEAFRAWRDCMDAYARNLQDVGQPQDPVLMHNFSAEAQAVAFEREFMREGQGYRPLHPRVVMLLEHPNRLRQFLYLGMLEMIHQKQDPTFRWELTWPKGNMTQTFWLTRGWNKETDRGARPIAPDIMNAIHGYVIRGQTWMPGRRDEIDYEYAERFIQRLVAEREAEQPGWERKALLANIELGLVARLQARGYDPQVPDRIVRQDFADLARVAESMLRRRLAELDQPVEEGVFASGRQVKVETEPEVVRGRMERIIENQVGLRQFLYLGMLGMVRPGEDAQGFRWELTWHKSTGEQVLWLTPAWSALTDRHRPRPDAMDAIEGYVLNGQSVHPSRPEKVDYEFAEYLIKQKQRDMGLAEEARMLQMQLERGFIAWLSNQAYDRDVPGRVVKPEYAHLAKAAERIVHERLDELQRPVAGPAEVFNPFDVGDAPSYGATAPRAPAPAANPAETWAGAGASANEEGPADVDEEQEDSFFNPFANV